ncbi:MAG: VWA domain-containing protein, partial [Rhodospirillaceae bacterium]|nr:VWA domain-containing protein [Rhodospirillaceae bacterium]
MRHVLHRALVGLSALGCGAAAAHAGPPPTVMVIDSSGSMAAQEPDGRTRLDAARATIARALAGWPEGGDLAVIAYGHRRQGDCADIETIVPLGPLSLPQVEERLARLRARGKTPIGAALKQAAGLLPDSGGTIVLVSDGLETCGADPCAVAEALRRANASLVIHVIGLGMTRREMAELSCIAENGGGRPFDAADASGLATALGSVVEEIVATAPAAEPEP